MAAGRGPVVGRDHETGETPRPRGRRGHVGMRAASPSLAGSHFKGSASAPRSAPRLGSPQEASPGGGDPVLRWRGAGGPEEGGGLRSRPCEQRRRGSLGRHQSPRPALPLRHVDKRLTKPSSGAAEAPEDAGKPRAFGKCRRGGQARPLWTPGASGRDTPQAPGAEAAPPHGLRAVALREAECGVCSMGRTGGRPQGQKRGLPAGGGWLCTLCPGFDEDGPRRPLTQHAGAAWGVPGWAACCRPDCALASRLRSRWCGCCSPTPKHGREGPLGTAGQKQGLEKGRGTSEKGVVTALPGVASPGAQGRSGGGGGQPFSDSRHPKWLPGKGASSHRGTCRHTFSAQVRGVLGFIATSRPQLRPLCRPRPTGPQRQQPEGGRCGSAPPGPSLTCIPSCPALPWPPASWGHDAISSGISAGSPSVGALPCQLRLEQPSGAGEGARRIPFPARALPPAAPQGGVPPGWVPCALLGP